VGSKTLRAFVADIRFGRPHVTAGRCLSSPISKSRPALQICATFMGQPSVFTLDMLVISCSHFFQVIVLVLGNAVRCSLHLEYKFQLNRKTEGKTSNAIYQSAGILVFSEDVLQEFGSTISYFRRLAEAVGSCRPNANAHEP